MFAAVTIFFGNPENPTQLALMAIGFQMALSVTRHFDMAIRWSINVETSMTTMQRLLEYIDLPSERKDGLGGRELKMDGKI
jgi:hypothetical protein